MDTSKLFSNLKLDSMANIPMYLQIANCLTAKITDGQIPSNTKLPPERQLAEHFGVSRTTAISAYRLLEERGLISTRMGSGTYVNQAEPSHSAALSVPWEQLFIPQHYSPLASLLRSLIAAPAAGEVISMAAGLPDPALYPVELFERALHKNNRLDPADLGHIPTEGYLPFKQALSHWLQQGGIGATPETLLTVSGSQQGLYLAVKTLIEPRDYVIVESPTYLGAIQILESAGARILCLPQSGSYDLGLLEDYLIRYRPKLFYTIPTFQNPSGRVASLRERQELIALAGRHRLPIIEDDPYSPIYFEQQPPPSLKALDNYGGVIYLGTFSKILFPGLRLGWIAAPQAVIHRLALEKQYIDLHSNNMSQLILQKCLEEDYLPQHLKRIRAEYKKRRDAMARALNQYCRGQLTFEPASGGFYLWCKIQAALSPSELLHQATAAGISFVPGEAFYTNGSASQEIRLSFSAHDPKRLQQGIAILGKLLTAVPVHPARPLPAAGRPII
jgi:DNA-binding transcriptional MocR family regulator